MNTKSLNCLFVAALLAASPAIAENPEDKQIDEIVSFASATTSHTLDTEVIVAPVTIQKIDASANTRIAPPPAPVAPPVAVAPSTAKIVIASIKD